MLINSGMDSTGKSAEHDVSIMENIMQDPARKGDECRNARPDPKLPDPKLPMEWVGRRIFSRHGLGKFYGRMPGWACLPRPLFLSCGPVLGVSSDGRL